MKVIIFNHETVLGGAEIMLLRFIRLSNKEKFQYELVVPKEGALKTEAEKIGTKVHVLPLGNELLTVRRKSSTFTLPRALALARGVSSVKEYIRTYKPDVVFSNSMKSHVYGSLAMKSENIPYGWRLHDIIDEKNFGFLQRNLLYFFARRYPQNIAAVSEAVARPLHGAKITYDNVTVIYNGIEIDNAERVKESEEFRLSLGLQKGHFVVTLPGRIMPQKGHELLIRAARIVKESIPNIRFLFVGDPFNAEFDYKSQLVSIARDSHVDQYFVFAGFQQDMQKVYAASDLIVQPSLLPDSFPTVLLEAMAARRIVIASDAGGANEIVSDGQDGFIVQAGNVNKLAEKIITIASNPAVFDVLKENARTTIVAKFSSTQYVEAMESWIMNLQSRGKAYVH